MPAIAKSATLKKLKPIKSKAAPAATAAPVEQTKKSARDIAEFIVKVPVDKQMKSWKRLYYHKDFALDVPHDDEEICRSTFYIKNGKTSFWNLPTARKEIKAWLTSQKKVGEEFCTDDIISYHKVFGSAFGDNTRGALSKFIKQGFLSRRREPPSGRRFHYVYKFLKAIPEELSV